MKNRKVVAVVILLLVGIGVWALLRGSLGPETELDSEEVFIKEPIDVVLDFYEPWHDALQSTTTNPYELNLVNDTTLSGAVQEYIKKEAENDTATVDPVMCQTTVPEKIGAKYVYQLEDTAQVIVLPRGVTVPERAIITLELQDTAWQIIDIVCVSGESAPVREFSFVQTGNLLKNVPAPLDSQYWHIVFEEDGEAGHTAPLFFGPQSTCVLSEGTEQVCDTSTLYEAAAVTVKGEMTEAGVDVIQLQFLE